MNLKCDVGEEREIYKMLSSNNRIVSWDGCKRNLQLNSGKLEQIVSLVPDSQRNLPIGILAIVGHDHDGFKSFWAKVLINYYNNHGGDWTSNLQEEIGSANKSQSTTTSGMYLWPKPFGTKELLKTDLKLEIEPSSMLVWIAYVENGEGFSNKSLDMLGTLLGSKVVEVLHENQIPRLLQFEDLLETRYTLQKHLSTNLACIMRKAQPEKPMPITRLKKLKNVCGWDEMGEMIWGLEYSSSKCQIVIAVVNGTHVAFSCESMASELLDIITVLTEQNKTSPKKLECTGKPLTVNSLLEYLDYLVTNLNAYFLKNKMECREETNTTSVSSGQETKTGNTMVATSAGLYPKLNLDFEMSTLNNPLEYASGSLHQENGCDKLAIVNKRITSEHNAGAEGGNINFEQRNKEKVLTKDERSTIIKTELYPFKVSVKESASFLENLKSNLELWISEHMRIDNVSTMISQVYEELTQQYPSGECQAYQIPMQQLQCGAERYCSEMKHKFDNFVCFAGENEIERLEGFFKEEKKNIMDSHISFESQNGEKQRELYREMLQLIVEKLEQLFRGENEAILKSEQYIASIVTAGLCSFYLKKTKSLGGGKKNMDISQLRKIHQNLLSECIQVFHQSMDYPNRINDIILTESQKLEQSLNQKFKELEDRFLASANIHKPEKMQQNQETGMPLVIYFSENNIHLAVSSDLQVSVPSITATTKGRLHFGDVAKDIPGKRSVNSLIKDTKSPKQKVPLVIDWLKDTAQKNLKWIVPSGKNKESPIILIVVPDWFSESMKRRLQDASSARDLACSIVTASEAAAVAAFETARGESDDSSIGPEQAAIISEEHGKLHINIFEREDSPTPKNPVKLVGKTSGDLRAIFNPDEGKKAGLLAFKFRSSNKPKSQNGLGDDYIWTLFRTAASQLRATDVRLAKRVLLLCHSAEVHQAFERLAAAQTDNNMTVINRGGCAAGNKEAVPSTVIEGALLLLRNCAHSGQTRDIFGDNITHTNGDACDGGENAVCNVEAKTS